MNLFPPNVEANVTSIQIGKSIALRNMFTASDLDGNPIVSFRFRDNGNLATSGFFTVRGVRQAANVFIEVGLNDIDFVRYHAGLIVSSETFSVQVGDGQFFSNISAAQAFTIPANNFPPTITPIPGTVLEGETLDPRTLFTVSDPENNPIVRYFFVDRSTNSNGGHFLLNGVRQPSGVFFVVEANQLDSLTYVGASFGHTENIGIQAFDGDFWSSIVDVPVTTTPNLFRPVTTAFNVNSAPGRILDAESLFNFSDADGNTLKSVWFLDTGTAPNSGFFTINGVQQAAGTFFNVNASELGSVKFHVSNNSGSEVFRVATSDGRFTSAVASATVNSVPRPRLNVPNSTLILDTLQRVNFATLVSQADNGPPITSYQVLDLNPFQLSARLLLNGQRLEQGVVHTLTPQQFASLQIEGGTAEGRFVDNFLVRGRNPLFFTEWEKFRINTDPVGPRSLDSGLDWGNQFFNGEKHVITYSFIDGFFNNDPPRPPLPNYYADDDPQANGTLPLDFVMRQDIRQSLRDIESYTNIEFLEVPYTLDAEEATLLFGSFAIDGPGSILGLAFLPMGDGRGSRPGDIWFDTADFPFQATPVGPGTTFRATAIHELGHALGFDHTFENVALPIFVDLQELSVMTQSPPLLHPEEPSTFMLFDVQRIQQLYGVNTNFNTGNDHYRFTQPNLQILWDAGGRDTINYTNHVTNEIINLNEGAFSSIRGQANSLMIAYGTVIENARGGRGNDIIIGNSQRNLLFGNEGNDILEGGGGNDVLRGGAGDDIYIWRTGDGRDVIDEEQKGGQDAIHIFDDTALDSLQNDLVFRRFGRDLRIDMRFNRQEAQGSIIVKDQAWAGSRVETLRLFNNNGDQIGNDIDLNSIFQQATTNAQFFRLTNQETANGFIAVPV